MQLKSSHLMAECDITHFHSTEEKSELPQPGALNIVTSVCRQRHTWGDRRLGALPLSIQSLHDMDLRD